LAVCKAVGIKIKLSLAGVSYYSCTCLFKDQKREWLIISMILFVCGYVN